MISQDIQRLIIKYLNRQATLLERNELEIWLENDNNYKIFKEHVKINYLIDLNMEMFDGDGSKKELLELIDKEKKQYRFRKYARVMKYAAVLVGVLASAYFFQDNIFSEPVANVPVIVKTIEPGTNKATLTLDDGSQVALEKGSSVQIQNANSNGEALIYDAGDTSKEVAYNYLTIPRGGQFFVKLSDGTQVWLNSESQLKYPVNFVEGETRKVELVYGEAYFDVSPSTEHKGAKFKVFNNAQEVEVIGTEFNIKAYKDETNVYTTLVEGKIAVGFENGKQNLLPNEQSNFNLNTKNIVIIKVDVYNEISWKDGVFSFERKPLKDIMKVLSRWYDMEVVFENNKLEDVKFFGVLDKEQNIIEILETIKKFKIIESYEVKNKTIILK